MVTTTLSERMALALAGPPKISQKSLADACGISPPSVSDWVSGKTKTVEGSNLLAAAKHLNVSANWLARGVGPMRDAEASPEDDEFVEVRRADVKFSNGTGHVVYFEDDRPPLVFRADFLRRMGIAKGNAVVVDASGISNEPKIADGSVVLVNRGDSERLDGGFFAFRFDNELLIKRLETIPDVGILATAENSNFKPKSKVYTKHQLDQLEVIGRAVWMGSIL